MDLPDIDLQDPTLKSLKLHIPANAACVFSAVAKAMEVTAAQIWKFYNESEDPHTKRELHKLMTQTAFDLSGVGLKAVTRLDELGLTEPD